MSRQSGYTLMEVLIVIAILAAVILMAAPLSGGWTANADLQQAQGQLKEAVSRAKSLALRNADGARGATPVAAVCLGNNIIAVRKGTAAAAPKCTVPVAGDVVWQAPFGGNVQITSVNGAFACACFNNKGLITATGSCAGCTTSTDLKMSAGSIADQPVVIY